MLSRPRSGLVSRPTPHLNESHCTRVSRPWSGDLNTVHEAPQPRSWSSGPSPERPGRGSLRPAGSMMSQCRRHLRDSWRGLWWARRHIRAAPRWVALIIQSSWRCLWWAWRHIRAAPWWVTLIRRARVGVCGGQVEYERLVEDRVESALLDVRLLLGDALSVVRQVDLHVRVCMQPAHTASCVISSSSSSSSFYLPNNTTACTFARTRFQKSRTARSDKNTNSCPKNVQ